MVDGVDDLDNLELYTRHKERRGFPRWPEREGVPILNLITLSSTD